MQGENGGDLIGASEVRRRLGGISGMSLWRWIHDEDIRFPQPDFRICDRRFWRGGTVDAWLAERAAHSERPMDPPARKVRKVPQVRATAPASAESK